MMMNVEIKSLGLPNSYTSSFSIYTW